MRGVRGLLVRPLAPVGPTERRGGAAEGSAWRRDLPGRFFHVGRFFKPFECADGWENRPTGHIPFPDSRSACRPARGPQPTE